MIEQSNKELELKLDSRLKQNNNASPMVKLRENKRHNVDTIHNHRNTLAQEVIYEVDGENGSQISRASSQSTLKPDSNTQV